MIIYLNEILWFGKYKGDKLIDVIINNPLYVKKLKDDYNIDIGDDINKVMGKKLKSKSIRMGGFHNFH